MKKQIVVRSYSPNCKKDAEELTEAFKNGFQLVRASEFIPPQGSKVGYIEYILEEDEDSPEEEKLRQELKANRNVQEALRKELGEVIAEKESLEALIQTITNLPPAAPTQEWIPVSERLPEEEGKYLTSVVWVNNDCTCTVDVALALFDGVSFKAQVLAWMPLPAPYKSESEGEDEQKK